MLCRRIFERYGGGMVEEGGGTKREEGRGGTGESEENVSKLRLSTCQTQYSILVPLSSNSIYSLSELDVVARSIPPVSPVFSASASVQDTSSTSFRPSVIFFAASFGHWCCF